MIKPQVNLRSIPWRTILTESALSVGELASRCGVKVSTLHYYEERGLITSVRNSGNQRRFRKDVIRRVSLIKAAQKMGLTLQSIEEAFRDLPHDRTASMADWQKLSKTWRDDLNQRIAYLEQLRDHVTGCIGCGCLSMKKCPIYNADDKLASKGPGPVILDQTLKSSAQS